MMVFPKNSLSFLLLIPLLGMWGVHPGAVSAQEPMGDFLFSQPRLTMSLNLGYGVPRAGSDLFDEVVDMFTLEKGDFNAPVVGGGLAFFLNDRIDLAFEFSYSQSNTWSEYTDWVDDDDLPIEQETRFTQVPLTLSFRYFLMDRGREIGNLSWIPTSWAPYIGVGGGRTYYEFQQSGDFVDFVDNSIFGYDFRSEGWSWVGHAFGGIQWAISPQLIVSFEGRYSLADADLQRPDYVGYEPIDLSGFKGTVGFGIRF